MCSLFAIPPFAMALPFASPPLLASIQAALDQPVFPGKVVVWLLFMLSIIGWVMIISKFMQLRKAKQVDRDFTERLRKSKSTLEVFEEGWDDEISLKNLIYQSGARETAYQLLGSREPQDQMQRRLREAGKLSARQLEFLRLAFQTGYRASTGRLRAGVEGLVLLSASALFLGLFGLVWTLMGAFNQGDEFAAMAPKVGAALGYLALALIVAAPPYLSRLAFCASIRRRREELGRFRDDIRRLFERSFAAVEESTGATVREATSSPPVDAPVAPQAKPASPHAAPPAKHGGSDDSEDGKKRYHSIRERLLRQDDDDSDPFEVNPIARQTATIRGY